MRTHISTIQTNLSSGVVVALLALPLSIGISVASGFPAIAGVMTAIVGGLLTGLLGGAPLSIKGPAAGMIVIVLGAVTDFQNTFPNLNPLPTVLAIVVISGVCQVILGLARFGTIADLLPSSVITGILSAVGIIIVGKQLHLMLGVVPDATTPIGIYQELPHTLLNINPVIAMIGLLSLSTMIWWKQFFPRLSKTIPAPLIVVIFGILVAKILGLSGDTASDYSFLDRTYQFDGSLLISMPKSLFAGLMFPEWSQITSLMFWKYVFLFALVGSLESTLIVEAINGIAKDRRPADINRDLVSIGIGNVLVGSIGGIPMISEIVRSRANIDAGATSWLSNAFHGTTLLIAVVLLPSVFSLLPTAATAGILVYVGFRLINPKEFMVAKKLGGDQLLFLVLTVIASLAIDILSGLFIGLGSYLVFISLCGGSLRRPFLLGYNIDQSDSSIRVSINGPATFANVLPLRKHLSNLPANCSKVIIDLKEATLVDHNFLAKLVKESEKCRDIVFQFDGLGETHAPLSNHQLATRMRRKGR